MRSVSPESSLVRRAIDLNYANKLRADSIKWIFINATLFFIFVYDLSRACVGAGSALHWVEGGAAGALALCAAWHARRLLPRSAPAQRITRAQQRLLGLHDQDLDSSFRVCEEQDAVECEGTDADAGAAERSGAGGALAAGRAWRRAPAAARTPPARTPPAPAPRPPPDAFIADRHELDLYLSAARSEWEWSAGCEGWAGAGAGVGGAGSPHQLSPLRGAPAAGPGAPPELAARADLWRRLDLDPRHLDRFELNMRRWLHATVVERVVREVEACDALLGAAGHEARVGSAAAERLAALADVAPAELAGRLRALLPFLRPFPDQRYWLARVRDLARGGCLPAYRWDGGGADWSAARPSDAELVLHLFAAYMDGVAPPGGAFSARHLSAAPAGPPPRLALHVARRAPLHVVLALPGGALEVPPGRRNLLHTLVVLVAAAARLQPPALCRLHLGPAGLNMLWILGR